VNLTIEVTDVVGSPISGADISVASLSGVQTNGKSDGQGRFAPGPVPSTVFRVDVTHPAYLPEEVEVSPSTVGGPFLWNNPVCSVTTSGVTTIRLSRVQSAPTFTISNSELIRRDPFNPQAVFTWTDNAGNPTRRYLALHNTDELIVPIGHPLLPDEPGEGWGRLKHGEPVRRDPSQTGNFVWLEWGLGEGKPRLLVAVWVPRFTGPTPTQLDFVVFFSPNTRREVGYPADTFPWLDPYPYKAVKGEKTKDVPNPLLTQPYPSLGQRFLFREKWLIYQLLAARCQTVVIFPIQPSADWGPFGQAAGIARLIGEVSHLLHRTALISGGQTSRDEDRILSPRKTPGRTAMHLPPPQARRVVLSGFSGGVEPIVNMLGTSYGQKLVDRRPGLDHALFGADVAPFLKSWMEVWDHDAPNNKKAGFVRDALEKAAPIWMKQNNQRMLRCYQSQYTDTPNDWVKTTPLAKFTPGPVKPPVDAVGHKAAERHADNRCSLVYFDNGYLKHTTSATEIAPVFWKAKDDHQAVPMVTFGHAASLSGLARM
jgi:hypothetical protein